MSYKKLELKGVLRMYEIEVDYGPAYELVTSLYFYINKDRLKIYELGSEWKKEVDRTLTGEFKEVIKDKKMEVLHRLNLFIHRCPGERTVEQFIEWFEQLPSIEVYQYLVPWVQAIPKDIKQVHQHIVYLLSEWNKQYFKGMDRKILDLLALDANQKEILRTDLDAMDLVEFCTNGIRIQPDQISKVILIPQYHYSPTSIIDYFEDYVTCLYPLNSENLNAPFLSKSTIHQLNSLSDQNRMLILKYLYEGPKTFTELLTFTKLVKSNLHYHLSMLRTAGFIAADYSNGRIDQYRLRIKTLNNIQDKLFSYIKGE